jgi:hypothetical protein
VKLPKASETACRLADQADTLSEYYGVGTPVRFWPGAVRSGPGKLSRIAGPYKAVGESTIVVMVEDHPEYVRAVNVEPIRGGASNG